MSDDMMVQIDQLESATETPADYDISIGGVACQMKYTRTLMYFGKAHIFDLHIPLKGVLQVLEVLPHADLELPDNSRVGYMVAIGDDGTAVFTEAGSWSFKWEYEQYSRKKRTQELQEEYSAKKRDIAQRMRDLEVNGLLIASDSLLTRSTRLLYQLTAYRILDHHRSGRLPSLIRTIENELDRLEKASPREEFIKGMLSGAIRYSSSDRNLDVIMALESLSVRSGGFIERLNAEKLEQHFRRCLDGCASVDEFHSIDWSLRLSDYAPRDIVDDPELGLAPEQLTLPGNKGGVVAYPVTYSYRQQDGEEVPTGTISVPLAVYKKLAPEYKQASGFPELPHDIRLYLVVTCDGKVLVQGFDTAELADKVRKAEKARGRKKHAEAGGTCLITGLKLQPDTTAPWWYQGATKPGRRR